MPGWATWPQGEGAQLVRDSLSLYEECLEPEIYLHSGLFLRRLGRIFIYTVDQNL